MRMRRMLGSIMMSVMLMGCIGIANAEELGEANVGEEVVYQETSFQINFKDLSVEISEQGELIIDAEKNSEEAFYSAERDVDVLERIFEEFPDVEQNLADEMQSAEGSLVAVSFTSVPLMEIDGHYERIPVDYQEENVSGIYSLQTSSDPNGKGEFLLYTTIRKSIFPDDNGDYTYTATTYGSWSNNILGGSNYPASSDDYALQACPDTFVRQSDSMSAHYDYEPTTGVANTDYWRESGGTFYVRYGIKDDPLGFRQLSRYSLQTESKGPGSSSIRQISSYYVHTWQSITLTVSIQSSSESGVSLTLTPSVKEKNWQVYNYVSFDF